MALPDISVTTGQSTAAAEAVFGNEPVEQPWNEIDITKPDTWTKEVVQVPGQGSSISVWKLSNDTKFK